MLFKGFTQQAKWRYFHFVLIEGKKPMKTEEIEERFIALESVIADNERTLKDLNQIVAEQAMIIDKLRREVFFLAKNFDSSGQVRPLSEEVPPPHY